MNTLMQMLDLKYPIIQAPMAGGATTPALVAGVSNNGGLGSLGAGYLAPEAIKNEIQAIRSLTKRAFSVNLFVPEPHLATLTEMQAACDAINQCASTLNVDVAPVDQPYAPNFEEQVSVLIQENIPIVSFTFGIPTADMITTLHAHEILVIGTATTLAEAQALQESHVDAIVAQGCEAGGHRGSFIDPAEDSLMPLDSLVSQLVQQIEIPIIASGGIMDGDKINQYLSLGASATQLGTAFLCCKESGIADVYKQCLLTQTSDRTVLTQAFSGKLARGVGNRFTRCMASKSSTILDYPIQNSLTAVMRKKAKMACDAEYMSLWAGQSVEQVSDTDVESLMKRLIEGMQ